MEGYRITGSEADASVLGEADGATLEEAVANWATANPSDQYIDVKRLTYWGCRLFDNEAEARRSFG